jgi:threonine dehydratase
MEYAEKNGSVFVHPFDHPDVIAGQGTIGLEIPEQLSDFSTVVVPVGGGGLISGIAAALRATRPDVRIVGVQAAGASSFKPSLERGEPVKLDHMSTIADGIAANQPGPLTFAHVRELVDEIVTVTDEALAQALVFAAERMKLVLEPAGAAGIAALMHCDLELAPPVVVVLSGGNIDPLLLQRVIRFGLSASGRYFTFHTRIFDRPGELAEILALIAREGANVVGVEHHREGVAVTLGEVDVAFQVETKGFPHIEQLIAAIEASGHPVARL